ncbi:hypothetical protein RHCRD62_110120 [Rhodococcus sp. RD6.2]|nr:hypothetical protein RHCRD62_110120 [Rhodococcus sp. RD6.2]
MSEEFVVERLSASIIVVVTDTPDRVSIRGPVVVERNRPEMVTAIASPNPSA